jgi:ligand-binding sensor domain-containing protein
MEHCAVSWRIKCWLGLSFLLVFGITCTPLSTSSVWEAILPGISKDPALQPESETTLVQDSDQSKASLTARLTQPKLPARFERAMDEFAEVLTGPSQVIQDQYGMIWIGSVDGLVRYDGYHYKFYQHDLDNPESLSSNQITALLEDRHGILWVGTEGD